jgi:hypothetical protein
MWFLFYLIFNELFFFIKIIKEEIMTSKISPSIGNYKMTQIFGYKGPGEKIL